MCVGSHDGAGRETFVSKRCGYNLVGPILRDIAILSLRCPVQGVLSFTQAHLCETPFCINSRENSAIPNENKQHEQNCGTRYRAI